MFCYYEGYRYAEGAYVCQGKDKYVCFEGNWRLASEDAPECGGEEASGWGILKTVDITLSPSDSVVGGWKILKTVDVVLSPSDIVVGGWKVLKTIEIVILPSGEPPPPTCAVDADCAAGYECVDGKCVKIKPEPDGEIPWAWIAAGAVGVGGIVLLTGGKKPVGKKKT